MQTIKKNQNKYYSFIFFLLFFNLIWNYIVFFKIVPDAIHSWVSGSNIKWFMTFFSIPFVVVGIGLIIALLLLPFYIGLKGSILGKGALLINKEKILPGESFTVTLQQTFKKDVYVELISARLVKYEYNYGTVKGKKAKRKEIVERFEESNVQFVDGQQIIKEYRFSIPKGSSPSAKTKEKQVTWAVQMHYKTKRNKIGFFEEYEFEVSG